MKLIYKIITLFTAVFVLDGCNGDDAGSSSSVVTQKASVSTSDISTSDIEAGEDFNFTTEKEITIIIAAQQSTTEATQTDGAAATDDTATSDTATSDTATAEDAAEQQVALAEGALHIYADLARAFADGSIAPDPRSRITTIHPHLNQEVSFMVNKNIEVIYAHWIPSDVNETEMTWPIVLNKTDNTYDIFL